jgi:hypothetical protein
MFWSKKPKPPQESLIAFLDEKKKPEPDPEQSLSEALAAYERHYYQKVSKALDPGAEEAKNIVKKAREFVSNSRLAYAVCRPILEHVEYWPAWSTLDNFQDHCKAPFRYLRGSIDKGHGQDEIGGDWASPSADSVGDRKPKTTIVTFSYNSRVYTLKFIDEGMLDWATDDWQGGPPLRRGLASA